MKIYTCSMPYCVNYPNMLVIAANESHFCDCCRNTAGHFVCALGTVMKAFSERPFALHCQQPENDKENVNSAPAWKNFCGSPWSR